MGCEFRFGPAEFALPESSWMLCESEWERGMSCPSWVSLSKAASYRALLSTVCTKSMNTAF